MLKSGYVADEGAADRLRPERLTLRTNRMTTSAINLVYGSKRETNYFMSVIPMF